MNQDDKNVIFYMVVFAPSIYYYALTQKKNLILAPTKEEKEKVENFSIERNLSVLTMQELISYRPKR